MRRVALAGGVAMVTAVVVAAGVWAGDDDSATTGTTAATSTAVVERRDLVVRDSYDGSLGFGDARPYVTERAGIVTSVPDAGTTVGPGEVLYSIDLEPTLLLSGSVPAYRELSSTSRDGPDIAQLEQALVDLGHGDGLTVDATYTEATAAAVTAWEEAVGRAAPDGVVALGDIVFAAGPLRVATVSAELGARVQSGATVVEATPNTKVVTVPLDVDRADELKPGAVVQLTLPDETETTGTVAEIGTETEEADTSDGPPGEGGGTTVDVTVTLDEPDAAAAFDTGTVEVDIERSRDDDTTAVPVTALLALAEGGYALQVVDPGRPAGYRLVGVEVGTFTDGYVGVSGDGIEPGVEVVVPE